MTTTARRQAKDALYSGFATIASALSSGRRVEIVEVLAQGERSVEAIADELDQSVANTSHHLRTLARAGLVATRRQGTHIHYRLASDRVLDAWLALRRLAAERLDDIERLARDYLGERGGLEVIDRAELSQRLERGDLVLLDVRPVAEYAAGHIPGAVSLPPDRLDRIDELLGDIPPDLDIAAYCRGPYCVYADDAVRRLAARGWRAMRLEDGFPEWRLHGGAVQELIRNRP
jgi:rhodanese-related sulfurtransferase/DNA-binding MarR family transcriptional regulator